MLKALKKNRGGFTLVEIMIVVAIIALLASIAVPSFLRARKRSQATRIKDEARLVDGAVDQYAIEFNLKPGDEIDAESLESYFKNGTRLQVKASEGEIVDLFDRGYNSGSTTDGSKFVVDSTVTVHSLTKDDLSDVLDASFWDPY